MFAEGRKVRLEHCGVAARPVSYEYGSLQRIDVMVRRQVHPRCLSEAGSKCRSLKPIAEVHHD